MELHGLCLRSFVYHVLAGWLWARPLATVTLGLLPCAVGPGRVHADALGK